MNVAKITENYKTSDNIAFHVIDFRVFFIGTYKFFLSTIDIFTSVRVVYEAKKYFYDLNNR